MDWNEAIEEERQVMQSVASRLLALAVLAERVAQVPLLLRCFVLWILRRAETVAFDDISAELELHGGSARRLLWSGQSHGVRAADAMWLARNFRTLARLYGRKAARAAKLQRLARRAALQFDTLGAANAIHHTLPASSQLAMLLSVDIDALNGRSVNWITPVNRIERTAERWNSS